MRKINSALFSNVSGKWRHENSTVLRFLLTLLWSSSLLLLLLWLSLLLLLLGWLLSWSSSSWLFSFTFEILEFSDILSIFNYDGNNLTKLNVFGAFRVKKLGDKTFFLHLEINSCLIGLNGGKNITWFDLISFLFIPLSNVSLNHMVNIICFCLPFPLLVKDLASQVSCEVVGHLRRMLLLLVESSHIFLVF